MHTRSYKQNILLPFPHPSPASFSPASNLIFHPSSPRFTPSANYEEIISWFQEKGIKMGNPDFIIQSFERKQLQGIKEETELRINNTINASSLLGRRKKINLRSKILDDQ